MTMTQSNAAGWRDRAVRYIDRTHSYYEAQGFDRQYQYAHHGDVPFAPLSKPLAECTVGVVTTASLVYRPPLAPRTVDSGSTSGAPEKLYTDDLSWDKNATHTDDRESFCPVDCLQGLADEGRIGALAPRFHCAPTEYSQRTTRESDAPEILERLRADGVDVAVLLPL